MPQVLKDANGHIIIELSRNAKKVRCITLLDTVRGIREFPLEQKSLFGKGIDKIVITILFDKEWTPVVKDGEPYPVKKAALRWLANNYNPLTERAKKELIMILVLKSDLSLAGKFADDQRELALETGPVGGFMLMSPEELAEEHSGKDIGVIYENLTGKKPNLKQSKLKLAEEIFKLAGEIKQEIVVAPKPAKVKKEKEVKIKMNKVYKFKADVEKLSKQAGQIVAAVKAAGENGIAKAALIEQLTAVIETKQPVERIVAFYQKQLVDAGAIELVELAA